MTSNLAADEIAQHVIQRRRERDGAEHAEREDDVEITRQFRDEVIRPILKGHFRRDEFLGRINEVQVTTATPELVS